MENQSLFSAFEEDDEGVIQNSKKDTLILSKKKKRDAERESNENPQSMKKQKTRYE